MKKYFHYWVKNERGVALIEFALVFPIMLILVFGTVECIRYILVIQKVQKAAYQLTNIVAQHPPATYVDTTAQPPVSHATELTQSEITTNIFSLLPRMMSPYGKAQNEGIIFSSFIHRTDPARNLLRWQISQGGANVETSHSTINDASPGSTVYTHSPNGPCTPINFSGAEGAHTSSQIDSSTNGALDQENILVGEIFYYYTPLVNNLLGIAGYEIPPHVIYRRFFMHPRNGDLLNLPSSIAGDASQVPSNDMAAACSAS